MPSSDSGRACAQNTITHNAETTSHFNPMLMASSLSFVMLKLETPGIDRISGQPKAIANPSSVNPLAGAAGGASEL